MAVKIIKRIELGALDYLKGHQLDDHEKNYFSSMGNVANFVMNTRKRLKTFTRKVLRNERKKILLEK